VTSQRPEGSKARSCRVSTSDWKTSGSAAGGAVRSQSRTVGRSAGEPNAASQRPVGSWDSPGVPLLRSTRRGRPGGPSTAQIRVSPDRSLAASCPSWMEADGGHFGGVLAQQAGPRRPVLQRPDVDPRPRRVCELAALCVDIEGSSLPETRRCSCSVPMSRDVLSPTDQLRMTSCPLSANSPKAAVKAVCPSSTACRRWRQAEPSRPRHRSRGPRLAPSRPWRSTAGRCRARRRPGRARGPT
jgi:hypothetical protein